MRWFMWEVWEMYGKQTCLDLCERVEEYLVHEVAKHFHLALTVATLYGKSLE